MGNLPDEARYGVYVLSSGGVLAELAPYRDCRLDLLPLLMPLRAAAPDQQLPDEPYRFHFDKLEAKYREITEKKK